MIDPHTHGRIRPEHVRHDLRLLDDQIERITARDPEPLTDEALRLLHEARAARMRQLRAMVLED